MRETAMKPQNAFYSLVCLDHAQNTSFNLFATNRGTETFWLHHSCVVMSPTKAYCVRS